MEAAEGGVANKSALTVSTVKHGLLLIRPPYSFLSVIYDHVGNPHISAHVYTSTRFNVSVIPGSLCAPGASCSARDTELGNACTGTRAILTAKCVKSTPLHAFIAQQDMHIPGRTAGGVLKCENVQVHAKSSVQIINGVNQLDVIWVLFVIWILTISCISSFFFFNENVFV